MTCHIIHKPDAEFAGTASSITGVAYYEVEVHYFFDRDCGGSDGPEVTGCELLHVQCDGLRLSRTQIALQFGESSLRQLEQSVGENFIITEMEYAA